MIRRIENSIDLRLFDEPAAYQSGIVNAYLERAGTPIGRADSFIAGHALSIGATLVTNNTREFLRVPNLLVEDWLIR